jgi:hypothetical protein
VANDTEVGNVMVGDYVADDCGKYVHLKNSLMIVEHYL